MCAVAGMQACAEKRGGTMSAVIGLETEVLEEICASLEEVWLANYNSPGQLVISGAVESVAQGRGAGAGAGREASAAASGLRCLSHAFHGRSGGGAGRGAGERAVQAGRAALLVDHREPLSGA